MHEGKRGREAGGRNGELWAFVTSIVAVTTEIRTSFTSAAVTV